MAVMLNVREGGARGETPKIPGRPVKSTIIAGLLTNILEIRGAGGPGLAGGKKWPLLHLNVLEIQGGPLTLWSCMPKSKV